MITTGTQNPSEKKKAVKIGAIAVAAYVLLVALLYFLGGEQLRYRDSRYNIEAPAAEEAAVELTEGQELCQTFVTSVERLEAVSVQWGNYYRENSGSVTMELYRVSDMALLLSQTYDVSAISEGSVTALTAEKPMEGLNGTELMLRLTSDSQPGSAVAPMKSLSAANAQSPMTINGDPAEGILCFSVSGQEQIWSGFHYWQLAGIFGLVLAGIAWVSFLRWKKRGTSLLFNAMAAVQRYHFLIQQLVRRNFKAKYKRSVLGMLWSLLNPTLTMAVQYVVFSQLFRFDIPYYPVYLLSGIILFNYFSEACSMTLSSISENAPLITKVYVPKYIFPLTRVMSTFINLLISLIPLLLAALISGIMPTKAYLLILYPMLCITVFCLGLGMLLATSMVFFRDTQFLWGIVSMIWMYLTPIFYPASILPENFAWVLKVNPLFYYVDFLRSCIIDGVSPEPRVYALCAVFACAMLTLGAFVFKKNQDKFVLYL